MQQDKKEADNTSEKTHDPNEWTTGSEPMSANQQSYLQNKLDEPVKGSLSNATAFNMIDAATQKKDTSTTKSESHEDKEPSDWVTGSEEMTDAQRSYLKTLADEAGEPVDENQSKATASQRIDELQQKAANDENRENEVN